MTVDLALLRKEAELLKREWDSSLIIYAKDAYQHAPDGQSSPGAVAERCIALIDLILAGKVTTERNGETVIVSLGEQLPPWTGELRR